MINIDRPKINDEVINPKEYLSNRKPEPLPSQIDKEVQTYSEWKASLEQEDLLEEGLVVKRPPEVLYHLYDMYLKFQLSPVAKLMREDPLIFDKLRRL